MSRLVIIPKRGVTPLDILKGFNPKLEEIILCGRNGKDLIEVSRIEITFKSEGELTFVFPAGELLEQGYLNVFSLLEDSHFYIRASGNSPFIESLKKKEFVQEFFEGMIRG